MDDEQIRPKQYCSIYDLDSRNHLLKLIEWLYEEVMMAGGDGDAIWYSEHYWVNDIFELVEEFNNSKKWKWNLSLDMEKGRINWYQDQSSIAITNSKEEFDNRPSWQQCSIIL